MLLCCRIQCDVLELIDLLYIIVNILVLGRFVSGLTEFIFAANMGDSDSTQELNDSTAGHSDEDTLSIDSESSEEPIDWIRLSNFPPMHMSNFIVINSNKIIVAPRRMDKDCDEWPEGIWTFDHDENDAKLWFNHPDEISSEDEHRYSMAYNSVTNELFLFDSEQRQIVIINLKTLKYEFKKDCDENCRSVFTIFCDDTYHVFSCTKDAEDEVQTYHQIRDSNSFKTIQTFKDIDYYFLDYSKTRQKIFAIMLHGDDYKHFLWIFDVKEQ